jgi:hypothetical protein
MGLRDWFVDNRDVATPIVAGAAWLGFSAAFGGIGITDWIVAAVLVGGGVLRRKTSRPKGDDSQRGIYGPPK